MARKKKDVQEIEKNTNTNKADQHLIEMPVSEALRVNYMPYAMSVIISRAIPEIDGFKPSHRKLLYTMHTMHLYNKKVKCANIVGQTMQLNPHGDASIYETMVRLTTGNETLLTPFILSKGNMSKHYSRDMAFAAHRYTEAGLAKIATEIFEGINKNAVDMVDNYDGTKKEPRYLPVAFPNILATPTVGIAVAMASNICSFNLKELCEATIEHIKHPKSDLLDIMPAPDFPTGGEILYNNTSMQEVYNTGKGNIIVRAKYVVDKKKREITITEIPYTTTTEAIDEAVTALCKSGKIKEIDSINDSVDKNGMHMTIYYKRQIDPDELMKKLFKLTPLQDTFSCNFNVIINGTPKVMGVYQILDEWVKFRMECLRREYTFDLEAATKKLHLLKGLEKILANIPKAIKIIMNTEKDSEVVTNLMAAFKIDEVQAEYIAEIKLRNINKEYILNRTKDITELEARITKLEKIIGSDNEIKKAIIKKLQEIAKNPDYVKPRKSTIVEGIPECSTISNVETVEDYPIKLVVTEHGYIKKIPAKAYKADAEIKIKEDDAIKNIIDTTNIADILVFTDKTNVYKCRISDIADCKMSEFGEFINNIAEIEPDEKILFLMATADYKGNIIIGFDNGKACKYPVNVYETKTNRKKLKNAFFAGAAPLFITETEEDIDVEMISSAKKKIVFNTSLIPLKTTKTTQGVQVIRLTKGAVVNAIKTATSSKTSEKYKIEKIPASGLVTK